MCPSSRTRNVSQLIEKIGLEGDKVSFNYVVKWEDRQFDVSFAGMIAESKLTGELEASQGTSKVTGAKRPFRRHGSSQN